MCVCVASPSKNVNADDKEQAKVTEPPVATDKEETKVEAVKEDKPSGDAQPI